MATIKPTFPVQKLNTAVTAQAYPQVNPASPYINQANAANNLIRAVPTSGSAALPKTLSEIKAQQTANPQMPQMIPEYSDTSMLPNGGRPLPTAPAPIGTAQPVASPTVTTPPSGTATTPAGATSSPAVFQGGNSAAISSLYDQQVAAAKAALEYQKSLINYQPQRNAASFQAAQAQDTINEYMASTGRAKSGYNITEQGRNQADLNQSLTTYNTQEQKDKAAIDQEIAKAVATGNIEKAKALIDEQNRIEEIARQEKQQNFENDMAYKNYLLNKADTLGYMLPEADQKIIDNMTPQEKANYERYSTDYSKRINELKADTATDHTAEIAALTALRNQKIANLSADEQKKYGINNPYLTSAERARQQSAANEAKRLGMEVEQFENAKKNWSNEQKLKDLEVANALLNNQILTKQYNNYDLDKEADRQMAKLEQDALRIQIAKAQKDLDSYDSDKATQNYYNYLTNRKSEIDLQIAQKTLTEQETAADEATRVGMVQNISTNFDAKNFNDTKQSYGMSWWQKVMGRMPDFRDIGVKYEYYSKTNGQEIMDYLDAQVASNAITDLQADGIISELTAKYGDKIKWANGLYKNGIYVDGSGDIPMFYDNY